MTYFAPSSLSERRLSQPKKSHQKQQKYGTDEPTDLDGRGREISRNQSELSSQADDATRHPLLQTQRQIVLL